MPAVPGSSLCPHIYSSGQPPAHQAPAVACTLLKLKALSFLSSSPIAPAKLHGTYILMIITVHVLTHAIIYLLTPVEVLNLGWRCKGSFSLDSLKVVLVILFTAGAEVAVCCLRSCLGLAVTRGNGFKMDSLSPCFRSMGLSEDRGEQEEENRSVLHPRHHLTHSRAHSCGPSALAIFTEQLRGLFLAAERSEIACWVIYFVLFEGEKVCLNTSAESKDCPDAPHRELIHTLAKRTRARCTCVSKKEKKSLGNKAADVSRSVTVNVVWGISTHRKIHRKLLWDLRAPFYVQIKKTKWEKRLRWRRPNVTNNKKESEQLWRSLHNTLYKHSVKAVECQAIPLTWHTYHLRNTWFSPHNVLVIISINKN